MIKPKLIGAALGLSLALGFSTGAWADVPYVALVSKGFQHQYWQAVKKGAEKAGQDLHVKVSFEGPETEAMVDKQIDILSATLARKPSAIGLAALDSQAATPLLKKAQAAKIPVIGFDSGVDSDIPLSTAATDNKAAAAVAADKMAALIGNEGEVAVVAHDQTSRTGIDRRDGFVERIKSKYPKIKVVTVQYGGGDQLKSTDITKSIITAHPHLKGIFGTNEGSAIGVVNGAREMKVNGKIVLVGFDSGEKQLDAIRSGDEAGAVTQNPIGIGYDTVQAAVEALQGKKLPKRIDTGFYWYDKGNIDDPKIAAVLYK
ncbi:ABC transporter substrate-binding protein [Paraburkholderia diazotrophica]|uniref:Monosaccharide ABC transporter substrate-binding protein, CUT2 family n=1 Tax=Paraburkholderia diazotrophica TaxID=667676 RepID=A0A1H7ARN5_9BURK|nr:ABC transporter substrate-binding protein [Paraburkholderia diazotrophica]SEJ68273.1 monosaccharide ABC transporter substrate-binding protein, CUT2 family [Paraburkholderia diazotrophica]